MLRIRITKYIIFRPKGSKINIYLENNGVFFNSNENFKDHLYNLTLRELETNAIRNDNFIVDQFILVKHNQIIKFIINDLELFSDELFKQKDVPVLVYIV